MIFWKNMKTKIYNEELLSPISLLEEKFGGADNLIRSAFKYSYFACPAAVRKEPVCFPNFARQSLKYYPNEKRGNYAFWRDGRKVKLEFNNKAQAAWKRYTGYPLNRQSGYGLRHLWGHPWDPDAYTAGWNFCYMPFWAGMLTEKQHPHKKLECAFRQASWNLYFAENPVCDKPDFVENPEMDLDSILADQPVLILEKSNRMNQKTARAAKEQKYFSSLAEAVKFVRGQNCSWSNLYKAVRALQGEPHKEFSTKNVAANSKTKIRNALKATKRECTRESLAEIEQEIIRQKPGVDVECAAETNSD